jgi:hypothetical protein
VHPSTHTIHEPMLLSSPDSGASSRHLDTSAYYEFSTRPASRVTTLCPLRRSVDAGGALRPAAPP